MATLALALFGLWNGSGPAAPGIPERVVVLTFDDAAVTHATFVAPLLKKYGFGATFFVCEFPPDFADKTRYMTWEQIRSLSEMGFEVGSHTRTHTHVNKMTKAQFHEELKYIEDRAAELGMPRPVSFAYPGYDTHPMTLEVLAERGYRFARAGGGRSYRPETDSRFLIPSFSTTGTDKERVMGILRQAQPGQIVVLTIHGVPDYAHPQVTTPPELFEQYLQYLHDERYTVIAMRDLAKYVDAAAARPPTLFIIGDSTVNNHTPGLLGWGDPLSAYFDPTKIKVENRARGGRSSRTFQTEGLWDHVLEAMRPGDLVLIQFGHNDGGSVTEGRARASLPGIGEETQQVVDPRTGKAEVVHTYGWYVRKYIADSKAKGATPIVLSPVPRNIWRNGAVARASSDYGKWAAEAARAGEASFLDLNERIAKRYEGMGPEKVNAYFPQDHTHTSPAGAELNAAVVVEGIKALNSLLAGFLAVPAGGRPVSSVAPEEPPVEWVDPETGHRVIRLSRDSGSASLYFHQNAYTADGDKMIFSTREGLSTVNLKTREIEQVVAGRASQVVVGRKTRQVFYIQGDTIMATHLDTRVTREIVKLPPGMRGGSGLAINADETLLAGSSLREPVDWKPPPPAPGENRLEARWAARLPMQLFTVRIKTGEIKTFHPSNDWLNHVQFSPTDPALLMFCHEGPWHKVDRIWTIRTDGSGLRKIHTRTMDMEIAGHEFFSQDGKIVWYDLQTPKSKVFWLAGVVLETGRQIRYELEREHWSVHFNASPDGKLFAGDGGGPHSVAAPGNGQWIYLFTRKNGSLAVEKLVNLAKHDYTLEPNVSFTPDGKWIVFRSNLYGPTHVFAVEVAGKSPPHPTKDVN